MTLPKRYKAKIIDLRTGERNVIINEREALQEDLKAFDRVKIKIHDRSVTAMLYLSEKLAEKGNIWIVSKLAEEAQIKDGDEVEISLAPKPESITYIKKKMKGEALAKEEVTTIVRDLVEGNIGNLEILSFAMAEKYVGMSLDEVEYLTRALVETGEVLNFDAPVYGKHSIGGIPGNKVSLLIVPIVAASGLLIPKTSSRAITSASGTADTMEILADVEFDAAELMEIAKKTGGAIVWGGMLNLAPGDDAIVRVENVMGIDPEPQMLSSIMAKKMATGVKNLVLDIPTGKGSKVETIEEATALANKFMELGRRLGIQIECGLTYGDQPVGHTVGPALEAKEALKALMGDGPSSLIEKSVSLAGLLLEMGGVASIGRGYEIAKDILIDRRAYLKMKEIIEVQGGDPEIMPENIPLGDHRYSIYAPVDGYITSVDNTVITAIARAAGAPKDRGAGLIINAKRGYKVKKGDKIMEIYAERNIKLQDAVDLLRRKSPIVIEGMLLKVIPEKKIIKGIDYHSELGIG